MHEPKEEGMTLRGHTHEHPHTHEHGHPHTHSHESKKLVLNRMARAIGHMEKVRRMVEEDFDCSEVLIQLAAVRGALDSTGRIILRDHIQHCIVDAVEAGDDDAVIDLCDAIDKFLK